MEGHCITFVCIVDNFLVTTLGSVWYFEITSVSRIFTVYFRAKISLEFFYVYNEIKSGS